MEESEDKIVLEKLQQALLERKRVLLYHEIKCEEALAEIAHYEAEIAKLADLPRQKAEGILDDLANEAREDMVKIFKRQHPDIPLTRITGRSRWHRLKDGSGIYAIVHNGENPSFRLVHFDNTSPMYSYTREEMLDLIVDLC